MTVDANYWAEFWIVERANKKSERKVLDRCSKTFNDRKIETHAITLLAKVCCILVITFPRININYDILEDSEHLIIWAMQVEHKMICIMLQ